MPRIFQRFALTILAVLACLGVAGDPRAPDLGPPIDVAVRAIATAERWTAPVGRPEWEDGAAPVVDMKAVEAGVEDEDRLFHVSVETEPRFRFLSTPREGARFTRSEPPRDTSRYAIGPGLARGPPA